MRTRRQPQPEFSFAAESFNLAGASTAQPMPETPRIVAEMTVGEREEWREHNRSADVLKAQSELCRAYDAHLVKEIADARREIEKGERIAFLAAVRTGKSDADRAMTKALANFVRHPGEWL